MAAAFSLDPRIAATSHPVTQLTLCEVRLQDDARFPWLVLVPCRADAVELSDLGADDQAALLAEINRCAVAVRALGEAWGRPVAKLNIANLGNVTPQLHWHVLGRRPDDPCWPGPVWGQGTAVPLTPEQAAKAVAVVATALARA